MNHYEYFQKLDQLTSTQLTSRLVSIFTKYDIINFEHIRNSKTFMQYKYEKSYSHYSDELSEEDFLFIKYILDPNPQNMG